MNKIDPRVVDFTKVDAADSSVFTLLGLDEDETIVQLPLDGTNTDFRTEALFTAADVPALVMSVTTSGYYTAGDGGGHRKVRISTPSPAKAWHSQSADGAWWEIREKTIRPQMLGAKADSTTDDADALEASQAYSVAFKVPVDIIGTFLLKRQLAFTGAVRMIGHGPIISKLLWAADATDDGISVLPTAWTDYVYLTDMAIWTRIAATGDAINVSWLPLGTTGLSSLTLRTFIKRCDIRGETLTTMGWKKGVVVDFAFGTVIEDNFIQGMYSALDVLSTDFVDGSVGVSIPDNAVRTLAITHFKRNRIFGFQTAVSVFNVEGIWFDNNDLQVCYDGLICTNVLNKVNQYRLHSNHIGVSGTHVKITNARQVLMVQNEISYRGGRTDGATVNLIVLDAVYSFTISSGSIRGNVVNDTDVVVNGISYEWSGGVASNDYTRRGSINGVDFQNLHDAEVVNEDTNRVRYLTRGLNTYDGIRGKKFRLGGGDQSALLTHPTYIGTGDFEAFDWPSAHVALVVANTESGVLALDRQGTEGSAQLILQDGAIVGSINTEAGGLEIAGAGAPFIRMDHDALTFFPYGGASRPTVTGSRATGDALVSLLTVLDGMGLINDTTTA